MGNPGCFNLGHAFSYTTGNRDEPGSAPEGRWCLIKFRDDVCNCIDDYEVVGLKKGDDNICHALAPDPYHGSYQWYKMDVTVSISFIRGALCTETDNVAKGTGKCPTSGCFEDKSVVESVPDADKRSVGHEITSEDVWANSYVGVLGKRRLEVELD